MYQYLSGRPRKGVLANIASVVFALFIVCCRVSAQDAEILEAESRAIELIGDILFSHQDETTVALRSAGYQPLVDSATWNAFSPTRKIETAYLEAEQWNAGSGEIFLRKLAHVAVTSSEGLRSEPEVQLYLSDPSPTEEIEFRKITSVESISQIPNEMIPRILVLVDAINNGALGGPRRVAKQYFGLTDRQIYQAFRSSSSAREGFWKAIHLLECPPCQQKLAELARQVQVEYEGARTEPSLNALVGKFLYYQDETTGPWNNMREQLEQAVFSQQLSLAPEKVAHMQKAVKDWQAERAKIAERWVRSGMTPSAERWEREFFEYTRLNPQMAALWGFAVISFEENTQVFHETMQRYIVQEFLNSRSEERRRIVEGFQKQGFSDSEVEQSQEFFDAAANRAAVESWFDALISQGFLEMSDKRSAVYYDRRLQGVHNNQNYQFSELRPHLIRWYAEEVGPKPSDGYQYYAKKMGFLPHSESLSYFLSDPVNSWVGRMCPK